MNNQAIHQIFIILQIYLTVEQHFMEITFRIIVPENKFKDVLQIIKY